MLYGVIAYVPGHYVAYIRRAGGHWEIHNDLQKKSTNCRNPKNCYIKSHMLMYGIK